MFHGFHKNNKSPRTFERGCMRVSQSSVASARKRIGYSRITDTMDGNPGKGITFLIIGQPKITSYIPR